VVIGGQALRELGGPLAAHDPRLRHIASVAELEQLIVEKIGTSRPALHEPPPGGAR
jgi:hypothetical protein